MDVTFDTRSRFTWEYLMPTTSLRLAFLLTVLTATSACGELGSNSWPEPGVLRGDGFFEKSLVLECCFRGQIRSIQEGDFNNDGTTEIGVVAQTGIALLNGKTLTLKKRIEFFDDSNEVIWFGLNPSLVSDDESGFLIAMSGGGFGDVGLLDNDGGKEWIQSGDSLAMVHADLDSDGDEEYYVSNESTISRLDADGKAAWKKPLEVTYLGVSKTGQARTVFAVAENGAAHRVSRNGDTSRIPDIGERVSGLSMIVVEHEPHLLVSLQDRRIRLLSTNGTVVFEHRYSGIPVYHGPHAAAVRFGESGPTYIAVLMHSSSAIGRKVFTLFDLSGTVHYQEVLEGGTGILAVRDDEDNSMYLLLSDGIRNLWKYEIRKGL